MRVRSLLPLLTLALVPALGSHAVAQDPEHATEFRMQHPGVGPDGKPPVRFLSHQLGTDHAEGVSMLDMNGDGYVDRADFLRLTWFRFRFLLQLFERLRLRRSKRTKGTPRTTERPETPRTSTRFRWCLHRRMRRR